MAQTVKICLQCRRPGFNPWVRKIPWRRKWQSPPVLLPRKSHGQRSLVGYSPWGRKESDTTEPLHFHFLSHGNLPAMQGDPGSVPELGRSPGEGNGNPLQYSCLENPMDRGAWWVTVPGVTKSQTRLSDFTSLCFCSYHILCILSCFSDI